MILHTLISWSNGAIYIFWWQKKRNPQIPIYFTVHALKEPGIYVFTELCTPNTRAPNSKSWPCFSFWAQKKKKMLEYTKYVGLLTNIEDECLWTEHRDCF